MLPLKIAGIGVHFPEQRETKDDFMRRGIPEDTIEKLGVYERRMVAKGQTAADLELEAARIAIASAGLVPSDIDLILTSTVLPEMIAIPNSNLLHYRLGATKAAAFDIVQGCGSSIPGLIMSANFIAMGQYERILFTTSTHWSVVSDPTYASSDFPLGDGAAAVVLTASQTGYGIVSFDMQTFGKFHNCCGIGVGHDRQARYYEKHDDKLLFFLDKSAIDGDASAFKDYLSASLPTAFKTALAKARMSPNEIDCAVIHGNVKPLADVWLQGMKIPVDRCPLTYHRYGNLSVATIFVNLQEGLNSGMIKHGDTVAFVSGGAGFSSGAIIMRWD